MSSKLNNINILGEYFLYIESLCIIHVAEASINPAK